MFTNEIFKTIIDIVSGPNLWLYFALIVLAFYLILVIFTWSFIRPFKFLATPSIIAGLILICFSLCISFFPIGDSIKDIVKEILNPLLKVGIIFIIMGVVMLILNGLLRMLFKKKKVVKEETSIDEEDNIEEVEEITEESNENKEDE